MYRIIAFVSAVFFPLCSNAQDSRFDQDVQYNIVIESPEDSVIEVSYEVLFENADSDSESYVTASQDSFLMVLMQDLTIQPKDTSQILLYIHGMWGGRRINFNKAYKLMHRSYIENEKSDIARIISLKWPGNKQEYKQNKKRLYSISDQIAEILMGFVTDLNFELSNNTLHDIQLDLLAHSLGTELLKEVIVDIDTSKVVSPYFDQMIVAAPDWDIDVFAIDSALMILPLLSNRTHVYYSPRDMTLSISKNLNKQSRFGLDGPLGAYVIADNVFYIDVSNVKDDDNFPDRLTGHNYYRASPIITEDILMTLIGADRDTMPLRNSIDSLKNTYRIIPKPTTQN